MTLTAEERSVLAELERQFPPGSGEPILWRRYVLRTGRWMKAVAWTCLLTGIVLTLALYAGSLRAGLSAYIIAVIGLALLYVSDHAGRPWLDDPIEPNSDPLDEVDSTII
ncbi:MAG: hypothetical protein OEW83_21740 [Acidimicrobiia bacterium]|nr:hypothetical protein [Acidimicrobiia bacterium]